MSHELFGSFHPNKLRQYQSQEFTSSVQTGEAQAENKHLIALGLKQNTHALCKQIKTRME
jgi:hypothetical protein